MGKKEVVKNVFGYFHQDPGSANLAKFLLVGGAEWKPRRSGAMGEPGKLLLATTDYSFLAATERKLHRLMVTSLAPSLDPTIDCIILAEGDFKLVDNFRNFVLVEPAAILATWIKSCRV